MFDRFTDDARKAMSFALQEAERLNHDYIGTEHILLGLCLADTGLVAHLLQSQNVKLDDVKAAVQARVREGASLLKLKQLPFTPRAKKVLEFAIDEARQLNSDYLGTEHLLLGVLREEESIGARTLNDMGVRYHLVREDLTNLSGSSDNKIGAQLSSDAEPLVRGFTDRADTVMRIADAEARNHNYGSVGTEHILLGLAVEGAGVAANVLYNFDVEPPKLRMIVAKLGAQHRADPLPVALPLTPGAEKAVEVAREEARKLGHTYVGTEHLLLSLLYNKEEGAAKALKACGVTLEAVRKEVMDFLGMEDEQS